MDSYLLDWVNLLLRWTHVIVGIAWIGASFYFVFLDFSLTKPTDPALKAKGVDGELWAVHGGGFYNPQKYLVAPKSTARAPALVLLGELLDLDVRLRAVRGAVPVQRQQLPGRQERARLVGRRGGGGALGFLVLFWFVYDAICRSLLQRANGDLLVGALVCLFVVAASWVACHLFAGRAAFLMVGAMMATAMSANVFVWIIPGQRKVIAQMKAGQAVDPIYGQRAKQRSVHNTYFTLPVLISMLSNHYGWLYQSQEQLAGAGADDAGRGADPPLLRRPPQGAGGRQARALGIRRGRHDDHRRPGGGAGAGAARGRLPRCRPQVTLAQVQAVVEQRCVLCHNAQVQQKNVALHTPELIRQHAQNVYQQAVVLKLMPMNNATQITDDERALIKRWYESAK